MSSEEEGAGQPESSAGALHLTDPKAMRAIAHPVRIALLELLEVTPTLTATQASEALGESPANCAFHLRTLAKYGFVREAGGGKGRERPWAATHSSITISTTAQSDKQAERAASALSSLWMERALERVRRAFTEDSWPDGWDGAVSARWNVHWMTPQETAEVTDAVTAALAKYSHRDHDPAARPAGALPVRMSYLAFPDTELISLAPDQHSPDQHSPDQHSPDQHSPDQHSPDQHSPDQHSPDEHSPDEHSPDEHSPDEHSPR